MSEFADSETPQVDHLQGASPHVMVVVGAWLAILCGPHSDFYHVMVVDTLSDQACNP